MNYKIAGTLKKNRVSFIVIAILWVILAIVFVSPIASSVVESTENGTLLLNEFMNSFINNMQAPFKCLGKIFNSVYIGTFFKTLGYFSFFYVIVAMIGIMKTVPKHQFDDIEHGSSDWSEHGEQYRILSNKKGIILAEDNYLPVDKRGNVNVLVVGRFRVW